ncbi:esterase-like activity of phytase family protein [Massilia sp. DWR3-1-1]|uniref:esterase-like activity of phytase family protein n=1 Tax=Massilia sp. DWR3-1-1 TaxID=2804559 RepID=UPI003CF8C381
MRLLPLAAALAAALFSLTATAGPQLLAVGSLNAGGADLSTQTAGPLENGVAGNVLGGMGSGLAWAGGSTFLATPDRGPNAQAYNPLVDDTTSYIARFQTVTMGLTANTSGSGLKFNLTPTLSATTLLSSPTALVYGSGAMGTGSLNGVNYTLGNGTPTLNAINNTNYFTGRSDGFDPAQTSANPNNARFDPEAVRVSNDGKSIFVSDEYGPYVYQFDRATGVRIAAFALPGNLAVSNLSARGDLEISGNSTGRVANKGMEGLAITPDGKTLVGIMQAPLAQDSNKVVRIVTIDVASGATHEYAYQLTTGSGVSDIVALSATEFLIDERDGKGLGDNSNAVVKQIFKVDLAGAEDVTNQSGNLAAKAVKKTVFIDLVAALKAYGLTAATIPSKIEGIAFGDDVMVDGVVNHTLYIANDNDFLTSAGSNNFYVFGVTDADLRAVGASYTAQAFTANAVPEPMSVALVCLGLMGVALSQRRRK